MPTVLRYGAIVCAFALAAAACQLPNDVVGVTGAQNADDSPGDASTTVASTSTGVVAPDDTADSPPVPCPGICQCTEDPCRQQCENGGACQWTCPEDTTCELDCPEGNCTLSCDNATTCRMTSCEVGCIVDCTDVDNCDNSCDDLLAGCITSQM